MIALVTGSLGRIGAAIATRLAAAGWTIALHGRDAGTLAPGLAAALDDAGNGWHVFAADLADAAAVDALLPRVAAHFEQPVRCVVNNASIIEEGGWDAVDAEALLRHHRVNVVAPILLARSLAQGLNAETPGCVVNIIDQRVANPPIDQAAYTASKLALASLTRVLGRAYAPIVRVNAVAPGLTIPGGEYQPGQAERIARLTPLQRLPVPAEIADAVAFLAGAEAISGQTIYVDGGASIESYRHDFVRMAIDH